MDFTIFQINLMPVLFSLSFSLAQRISAIILAARRGRQSA